MTAMREKQLRARVRAARATMKMLGKENWQLSGEYLWAEMYAQDVDPLRRHLAAMVIADVARVLSDGYRRFQPLIDARARAQKFLGGRPR